MTLDRVVEYKPPSRTPWAQWVRRSLAALGCSAALGCTASIVLLHSLERPWLKRRVQELAHSAGGVNVDYRALHVSLLSGADIVGLVVQAPDAVHAFAPELVRVEHAAIRWSLGSLLTGHGLQIDKAAISDITLTVVVDEHGATSFDALAPAPAHSAPSPAEPLSRQPAKLLELAAPLRQLELDHLTLRVLRTARGAVFDRTELHGAGLALSVSSAPSTHARRALLGLGSRARPLELQLSRTLAGGATYAARAQLWAALDATESELTTLLDLRMLEQTFATSVSADHWLHAQANLHFDPNAGRTQLTITHTEAGDGAATVDAALELSDTGAATIQHAHTELDLARLVHWLPAGLVPVTAGSAHLSCQVEALALGPTGRLAEGGVATAKAEFSNVAGDEPGVSFAVTAGQLELRLQPSAADANSSASRGSLQLDGMQLSLGTARIAANAVRVDFDGRQEHDGSLTGRAGLHFGRFERAGTEPIVARDGDLELRSQGLQVSGGLLAVHGNIDGSLKLAALAAYASASPHAYATAEGLTLHAHTDLRDHAPYDLELDARAVRLALNARDGKPLASLPVHLEATARDVRPDLLLPVASSGLLRAALDAGDLHATLDATKTPNALDFALTASARSLQAVRPLLPAALLDAAAWSQMAVALQSKGRVELSFAGSAPSIRHTTELRVDRPALAHVAARSVALKVASHGTALRHDADIDVRAEALAFNSGDERAASDEHWSLSASIDRVHPSLHFRLVTEGRATSALTGALSFDNARRALSYALDGELSRLASLAPFAAKLPGLEPFDLSKLGLALSLHGELFGVVAAVSRDGELHLEPNPERSARITGTNDLRVAHLRWTKGGTALVAPELVWHSVLGGVGERRTFESRLALGTLHLAFGSHDIDLNGVDDTASGVIIGNLAKPDIELNHQLAIRAVEQTWLPEYPLGELLFEAAAERSPEGVLHISELKFANGLGGTELALTGNVDLSDGRRTLSVTSSLVQDLARLSTIPERLTARGKLAIDANVTSPDFTSYRVRAAVKGEDVNLALPRAGINVVAASGEVPIAVELAVRGHSIAFERSETRNPYSMLRFADQHPLLTRSGFLSIAELKTPFAAIAPLVGNLEIEQNVISLRQFELGVRGGTVTGQCGVDWNGANSTLELHVRASGVQSSHGEPFDGNIAVAISAADRTIDGRAEVLRIGERHLLDLLDLQDPLHVDPGMNRIRSALGLGYPKSLRLVFDHGFANAHLELGGLAQFVSIAELRGIPMGPIFDKLLARMLDGRDRQEMP